MAIKLRHYWRALQESQAYYVCIRLQSPREQHIFEVLTSKHRGQNTGGRYKPQRNKNKVKPQGGSTGR